MVEGWNGNDYVIWFQQDAAALQSAYGLEMFLPGYRLVGLRDWDDFIVEDAQGDQFSLPTVPVESSRLESFPPLGSEVKLVADPRFTGRIKWYLKPIVFGGDPEPGPNVAWISVTQHAELVQWWNRKYREAKASHR